MNTDELVFHVFIDVKEGSLREIEDVLFLKRISYTVLERNKIGAYFTMKELRSTGISELSMRIKACFFNSESRPLRGEVGELLKTWGANPVNVDWFSVTGEMNEV